MRLTRVDVWNYRSIKQARFRPGDLTILVGPNNSGKSNLIRALDLLFNDADVAECVACVRRTEHRQSKYCTIRATFDGLPERLQEEIERVAQKPVNKNRVSLIVRYEEGNRYPEIPSVAAEDTDEANEIQRLLLGQMRFVRVPPIRDAERDLSLARGSVLRVILELLFTEPTGPGRRREVFRSFTSAFNKALKELNILSSEVAKLAADMMPIGSVEFVANRPSLADIFSTIEVNAKDPVGTQLADKGTGFQSSFLIAVMRFLAETTRTHPGTDLVFAIEEPDAFLHPNAQRAIWRTLEDISRDAQVVISTHSTVLVDHVKWPDFGGVVRVCKEKDTGSNAFVTVASQPILTDRQRQIAKHRSDLKGSEVFFAEGVIIVEGPGDRLVYQELARKEEEPLERQGIVVLEAQGGSFEHAISLCSQYRIPWIVLCDKDKLAGQKPLLDSLARYGGLQSAAATEIRNQVGRMPSRETDAERIAKRINRLLEGHRCHMLTSDLEWALVNDGSVEAVIAVLADPAVLGISTELARRWRELLDAGDTADLIAQVRKYLGSKGLVLNANTKNARGKKSHIPVRIAESLSVGQFSLELRESLRYARSVLLKPQG